MKAHNDFIKDFTLMDGSGIGAMFVRSREPHRVLKSVKEHAAIHERECRAWNIITGWTTFQRADSTEVADGATDPIAALKAVMDVVGKGANPFPNPGNYLMEGVHPWLSTTAQSNPNPVLIALLRQYARLLSTSNCRVIISVPEGFAVPEELVHDMPVIDYALPDAAELAQNIKVLFADEAEDRKGPPIKYTAEQINTLAGSAAGLTALEAEAAASQAIIMHKELLPAIPFEKFNNAVLATKTAIIKNSGVLTVLPPLDVNTVGGLDLAKQWINERKLDFTPEATKFGVKRPRGATLVGVPGTGKTLLAKCIAAVLGIPAVQVDFGALFGGIVGQTEAATRKMFKDLTAMGRVLVFIDEIDRVMGMNTTGGDGGVTKRVIGAFLTFMQDNDSGAFFVFALNNIEGVDSALIRPGRVDKVFSVLPPNKVERLEILRIHLRKMKQDPDKVAGLDGVVAGSSGYVGAELEQAVAMAVSEAFRTKKPVSANMLLNYVQQIQPMSKAFAESFERQQSWAAQNASPASTPTEEFKAPAAAVTNGKAGPARRRLSTGGDN